MSGASLQTAVGLDGTGIPFTLISAASINATNVYVGGGYVTSVECFTNGSTAAYLKLYDKATTPTTSDGARCIWEGIIPGSGGNGFGLTINRRFGTGLGFILSGGIALTDNTSVAANAFTINLGYIPA